MIKNHTIDLESVAAKYHATVERLAKLYVEIGQAHEEENNIINDLEDADIRYWDVMPRVHTSNIGCPSNEHSWLNYFLREAKSQGYLKKNDYL